MIPVMLLREQACCKMRIFDTLTRDKTDPAISNGKMVSVYLCGVTVYDDAHIGHARTIIVFDVLRRYLEKIGKSVYMVQNFTDVDDKIIVRAAAEDTTVAQLSGKYIDRYYEEFDNLNVRRADVYPKATEHIGEIIEFIECLVRGGAAYVSKNGVYFDVSTFPLYGQLSKKRTGELQASGRIETDATKRDPLDFALWKFATEEPSWDSPWGRGRPGWHIECSAMSTKYLGAGSIDIHGGGRDLIFPHHENEIAQSVSCTGKEFARIWMHVGMVTICGEKMSKSLGNIRSVRQVLQDWGPNTIRIFCLSGHYAKPIDYSEENLRESLSLWRQVEACHYELAHAIRRKRVGLVQNDSYEGLDAAASKFDAALADDLNTHLALSSLMGIVSETNRRVSEGALGVQWAVKAEAELFGMESVLGLSINMMGARDMDEIDAAIAKRDELRENKEYEQADAIRDELTKQNIDILDRADDTVWVKRARVGKDSS